jgi:hypothetical protein
VCVVLTGAQVEGTTIPEAMPVGGVEPEAEVLGEWLLDQRYP